MFDSNFTLFDDSLFYGAEMGHEICNFNIFLSYCLNPCS